MPEMMGKMPMDGAMDGEMGGEEGMTAVAVVRMEFFGDGTYKITEMPPEGEMEEGEAGEMKGGEGMTAPKMAQDWKQAISILAKINEKASGGNAQEAFDNPEGAMKPPMKGMM